MRGSGSRVSDPAIEGELGGMLPRVAAAADRLVLPADAGEWLDVSATDLLGAYGDGSVEPGDVLDACLARIAERDPAIGAVWAIDEAGALAAAERSAARWRAGTARPLEGVPILVKDLVDTAGLVTTGGSLVYEHRVPTADAPAVAAARAAGAIIVGKTATYELGCGDEQTPFGVSGNPWCLDRTTGGSSAGSAAALAARYVPLAIGTDTGGSIRIPSAYCGVTGLKPTLGRIPGDGLLGLAPTLDCVGPMARSATDAALLLATLTCAARFGAPVDSGAAGLGDGPGPSVPLDLRGVRIGVPGGHFVEVLDDAVADAYEAALRALGDLGAELVPLTIADAVHGADLSWLITMYEAAGTYAGVPRDRMTPTFRRRLEIGDRIDRATYLQALRARRGLVRSVCSDIAGVDAVVVPGTVTPAPRLDDMEAPVAGVAYNWPDVHARTVAVWNVTGLPAVAVPSGHDAGGLPVGIQIAGLPHADERCLAIAAAYQSAAPHHLVSPFTPARSNP